MIISTQKNTYFLPFSMHLLEFLVSSLMSADYEHYLKNMGHSYDWCMEFRICFFNIEYLKGYFKWSLSMIPPPYLNPYFILYGVYVCVSRHIDVKKVQNCLIVMRCFARIFSWISLSNCLNPQSTNSTESICVHQMIGLGVGFSLHLITWKQIKAPVKPHSHCQKYVARF